MIKLNFKGLSLLCLTVLTLLFSQQSYSQDVSGREFWYTMPSNNGGTAAGNSYYFYAISPYCVDSALLEIPQLNYKQYFSIQPGQYTQITLPNTIAGQPVFQDRDRVIQKKGIRVTSKSPMSLYAVVYSQATVDGEIVLPLDKLGQQYVVTTRSYGGNSPSRSTVFATEDNTNVTINTWSMAGVAQTLTIKLNRGETYMFSNSAFNCNYDHSNAYTNQIDCSTLTGSKVTADKVVGVIGHSDCSNFVVCGACDMLMAEYLPIDRWDTDYVTAQVQQRNAPVVTCLAGGTQKEDFSGDVLEVTGDTGTVVTFRTTSGVYTRTITAPPYGTYGYGYIFWQNPVEAAREPYSEANVIISSSRPVQVLQYSRGYQNDAVPSGVPPTTSGNSDPESIVIYPKSMWEDSYLLATLAPPSSPITKAVIVVNDIGTPAPITTIQLNGATVAAAWQSFGPVDATNNWKFIRVNTPLVNTSTLRSTAGYKFSFYLTAVGQAESYTLQGGQYYDINACTNCPVADISVPKESCPNTPVTIKNFSKPGNPAPNFYIWDYGDGTKKDTLTTPSDVTHSYDTSGTFDVTLTVVFNGPPPCRETVSYKIKIFPKMTIDAGPNQITCTGKSVPLGGAPTISGGTGPYTTKWTPATGVSDVTRTNPTVISPSTQYYKVTVTDFKKCVKADSALITVNPIDSVYLGPGGTICQGDSYQFTVNIITTSAQTFNITLSDGSVVPINHNGIVNQYKFWAKPSVTTDYRITSASRQSSTFCVTFDPTNVKVIVRPTPTMNISAGGTICKGDAFPMQATFLQTGNWSFTYTDGTTPVTRSNISSATSNFTVNPSVTTTYTINNLEYATAPKCFVNPAKQFTITVNNKPNPGLGDTLIVCQKASAFDLAPLLRNNPDPGGTWSDVNSSGALTGSVFNPVASQLGIFRINYTVPGAAPCLAASTSFKITVVGAPQFSNILENCDANLAFYKVTATVTGGDPTSYSSPDGTITQSGGTYTFTSAANYATKTAYSISIDDNNNCGPTLITGMKNCGCRTNPGTMNSTALEVCETDSARAIHNNDEVFIAGDTLIFYLHEGSAKTLVNVIDSNWVPNFKFKPGMVYGRTYYISGAAGPFAAGTVDRASDCYTVNQGTPVRFFQQVTGVMAGNNSICLGDQSPLDLTFSGIAPFSASINDGTSTTTYSPKNQRDTVIVSPTATTTYNLTAITDKYCSNNAPGSSPSTVTVNQPPMMVAGTTATTCNNTATGYTLTFQITGGDPASYAVTPSTAGTISSLGNGNYLFTSQPIQNGQLFTVDIDDANACGPVNATSTYTCSCITQAGTMSNVLVEVCDGSSLTIPAPTGQVLDGDDAFQYYVYSNSANPAGSQVLIQDTNVFTQQGLNLGQTYYVATIFGNDLGGGTVDKNERCFARSNGTPMRFNASPTVKLTGDAVICQNDSTPLNFTLTGAAPFTVTYDTVNQVTPSTANFPGTTGRIYVMPSDSTVYRVLTVTDNNGCNNTASDIATVDVNPAPSATLSAPQTVCSGTIVTVTVTFTGQGPYNFTFNYNGTSDTQTAYSSSTYSKSFNATSSSVCSISGYSDATCPGTATNTCAITVNQKAQGVLTATPAICIGDVGKLYFNITGSNGPYTVTYSQNGVDSTKVINSIDSLVATYKAGNNRYVLKKIVDSSNPNCTTTNINSIDTIVVNALPTGIISGSGAICVGQNYPVTVDLTGASPINFTYQDDQGGSYADSRPAGQHMLNQTPSSDTIYTYTLTQLTDANGCVNTGSGSATIDVKETPVISFTTLNATGCPPVTATIVPSIQAEGTYQCSWNLGNGNTSTSCGQFTEIYPNAGDYSLSYTVVTQFGCSASYSSGVVDVAVQSFPKADFSYSPAKPTTNDPIVNFDNQSTTNAQVFEWTFDTLGTSPDVNPSYRFPDDREGEYAVQLYSATTFGCADSITKIVRVGTDLVVYVPNSFTPNNDGVNDEFEPVIYGMAETGKSIYDFRVFDRWGNMLFSTTEYGKGWNGRFEGELVRVDSYVWSLKVRAKNSADAQEFRGFINIFR